MNLNKRYSIRKLSVGVASVAIGFFISTNTDLMTSIGQNISHIAYAEEVVKEWRPEGRVIGRGEDGVPWEMYENGYLLFKPTYNKKTLSGALEFELGTSTVPSWRSRYGEQIKAIGFANKVYAPINSYNLFEGGENNVWGNYKPLSNLEYFDGTNLDMSRVTDMYRMFSDTPKLKVVKAGNWDTSKVTNMNGVFSDARNLIKLDVSNWNTSKVTDMTRLFQNVEKLTSLDVSRWDVSNVTDLTQTFKGMSNIRTLNVDNWNTQNVRNLTWTFLEMPKLQHLNVSRWNTQNVESMVALFENDAALETLDVSQWNTRNVTTMRNMFSGTTLRDINVSRWNTSQVTDMAGMFASTKVERLDVSNWDTSRVENMDSMFYNASITDLNVANWDVSHVTNMNRMFMKSHLRNLNSSRWNTRLVTNMAEMFAESAVESVDTNNWNTSNVTNMSGMFRQARNLRNVSVGNWDVGKVTTTMFMFNDTNSLSQLDVARWNTNSLTNAIGMFSGATSLQSLDVSQWNTRNLTTLASMFQNTGISNLNLSNWKTNNVVNTSNLFNNMLNLQSLNISGWNLNKVTEPSNMFNNLSRLNRLVVGDKLATNSNVALFNGLETPSDTNLYSNRWIKEDGTAGPFTVAEWNTAYRQNPTQIAGVWVREKTGYDVVFNTDTTESIARKRGTLNEPITLPTPTVGKLNHRFLGWAKTQNGNVLTDTRNLGTVGSTINLYAKWERVNNVTTQRTPIVITTVYHADNTLANGQRQEETGRVGEKEVTTTYTVTPITGELTNPRTSERTITEMRPKVIKIGTKPMVEYIKKNNDVVKRTTTYTMNPQNGTTTSNVSETVHSNGTAATKVQYIKKGNNVVKQTTTYTVNQENGNLIPSVTEVVHSQNGAKDKVEYIKKNNSLVKRTTHYDVNLQTGAVTPSSNVQEETVSPSTLGNENITSLADKIEYVKQGNDVIKRTTTYDVNIETGKITPQVTDVTYNQGGTTPKVEYIKRGNDIVKQTTNYDVNPQNGEITPNQNIVEETVSPSSLGNENIDTLADKVEYFKQGNNVMKRVTIYDVDLHTGKVTPNITETVYSENGAKDKIEYIKQNNNLVKRTTHYDVDANTGNITPNNNVEEENVEPTSLGNDNIVSLADKIEYVKQGNDVIKRTTTYDVNIETGRVTPQVTDDVYNQGATTPKIEYIKRGNDIVKQTTNYDVNLNTGEVIPNSNIEEQIVSPASLGNENIDSLADKVEYFKQGNNIMKRVTTYDVDLHTGKVTSNVTETVHSENGAKDKVEYIKKESTLVKKTTHYDVDLNTGNVTPNTHIDEEKIEPSSLGNENITSLADKIEYVKQGNDVIKRTTTYDVNIETGKITPQVTDEVYNQGGTTPKVEYVKRGNNIVKQTTNYDVDIHTGTVTPNSNIAEDVVEPSSLGNANIDSLADKVEYFKQNNNVMKRVITYDVDLHTGKVTSNVTETVHNENGAKDKVEYVKQNNSLVKKTTHYDVDTQTGNVIANSNIDEETIEPTSVGNENIESLADKVEYIKQGNDVIKRTTRYDVNVETGKVTPQVTDETYNQGGTTPKVEYIKRGTDIIKQTTNYVVNLSNGEITPDSNVIEETVQPSSLGNENIESLADKVEYFKQDDNVMKRVTTYDVDLHTGKVTSKITETVHSENGAKDKVEYIKQDNSLIKKTTHYDVDINTGNVTPNSHIDEENIEPSSVGNENITTLADKVEYIKQGNDVIKRTTKYDVNVETGKVTPQVTDETYNQGGTTPKVEYIKRGNDIIKQTTNYVVNVSNGEVTPDSHVEEEVVQPSSLGNDNIDSLDDKIEYLKQGNNIMKRVTTYNVDIHTGKVTPNVIETIHNENGAKDKIEYIKKNNELIKKTTHYDVDTQTGNVIVNSNIDEETIEPTSVGNENIESLADKIEYVKQGNDVIKRTTTYDVNIETGKITPQVTDEVYNQGGTTPKVEYIKRGTDIIKQTTNYVVNLSNGEITPDNNVIEETVMPSSLGNENIENLADKVEYFKQDDNVMKRVTTYDVDLHTGKVKSNITETVHSENGAKDKVEYIKKDNSLVKKIIHYDVDLNTGNVTPNTHIDEENVEPSSVGNENITSLADKIEYVKQGNDVIKRTTRYDVNIETGKVTPQVTDETYNQGGITPKVEYIKRGNDIVKQTTNYDVDTTTGTVTPNSNVVEEIVSPASLGNNNVDTLEDKVEYFKQDNNVMKRVTTYDVDLQTGKVTPNVIETVYSENTAKDKIEYVKQDDKLVKKVTHYDVDANTGNVTPNSNVTEEIIQPSTVGNDNIDTLKDKVEYIKQGNEVIKRTTRYDVNVETGKVTPNVTEEIYSQGEITTKIEYIKRGNEIVKRTTEFDVDSIDGTVKPNSVEEVVTPASLGNNEINNVGDKVEYIKKDGDIIKKTTTYDVNISDGSITPVETEVIYAKDGADDSIEYIKRGNDIIKQITEYEVDKYTGEVIPKVREEVYVKDGVKDKVEFIKENGNVIKQITKYDVDVHTGNITSHIEKETHNPQGLDSVNDKVEYVKQGDTIVKREIKYDVDIHTGNVTPIVSETTLKNNDTDALKDKVEYIKKGNDIVKVTTIVTVEPDTGLLQSETIETVHIKDGADDSVTYIKRGNDVIKQVTKYDVDKYTGEVTSTIIEEIVQKDSVKDKVEYVKRGNEIVKQITTYKVNKDTGEITSEVTIDENVDNLTTSIDRNGNVIGEIPEQNTSTVEFGNNQKQLSSNIDKSLISNKENTKPTYEKVLVTNEVNISDNDESLMNGKENQELPKTNALYGTSYILGLLLSIVGLKQNKKD